MLTFSDPLTGFILPDTQVHVSLGWLLRPKEFRRQCRHTVQKPQFDSWAIYAQLPDSIVKLLESALVPRGTRVSILSSSAWAMYAVVVHQLAGLQLRCVLSVQDNDTQDWLKHCAVTGSVTMALEVPETSHLAILPSSCAELTEDYIDSLIARCGVLGQKGYCVDAAALVRHLSDAKAMPSLVEGIKVQEVPLVLAFEGVSTPASTTHEEPSAALH